MVKFKKRAHSANNWEASLFFKPLWCVWVGGGDHFISRPEVQIVDLLCTKKFIQKYRHNLHLSSREEIITKYLELRIYLVIGCYEVESRSIEQESIFVLKYICLKEEHTMHSINGRQVNKLNIGYTPSQAG